MGDVFGPILIGVILIVVGIFNMMGNINTLHWYHRQRVAEEDILPFGRLVGIGTIIVGAGVIIMGGMTYVNMLTGIALYTRIGNGLGIVGVVIGIGLNFYAMKKYNKGIF